MMLTVRSRAARQRVAVREALRRSKGARVDLARSAVFACETLELRQLMSVAIVPAKNSAASTLVKRAVTLASTVSLASLSTNAYGIGDANSCAIAVDNLITDAASNFQFVAFYDTSGKIIVGRRTVGAGTWQTFDSGISVPTADMSDDHDVISIGVDSAGFMHISWDMHNVSLKYAVSTTPVTGSTLNSIAFTIETSSNAPTLFPSGGATTNEVTYPQFYDIPNSKNLLFVYRNGGAGGGSGNGDEYFDIYTPSTGTWTNNLVINGELTSVNAYLNRLVYDSNDNLDMSWTWRSTPNWQTNQNIMFAQSPDNGATWFQQGGTTKYTLPIIQSGTPAASVGQVVETIPQGSSFINQTSMTVDANNNPLIATFLAPNYNPTTKTGNVNRQYELYYYDGSQWRSSQISNRTSDTSIDSSGANVRDLGRPVVLVDKQGRVLVVTRSDDTSMGAYANPNTTNNDIVVYWNTVASLDSTNPAAWQKITLDTTNMGAWEPTYDQALWTAQNKLSLFYEPVGFSGQTVGTAQTLDWDEQTYFNSPAVTTNPANIQAIVGQDVTFTAAATGTPAPTVQWMVETAGSNTFTAIEGATSTTLDIGAATLAETGNQYEAVFTNGVGNPATTTAATLTVSASTAAPLVTTNPTTQTLTVGQTITFTAAATGTPAPTVQWMVETAGSSTFTAINGATSTTLNLGAATLAESGNQYEAVFTNGVGSPATTTAATLTVNSTSVAPGVLINAGGPAVGSFIADADVTGGRLYSTGATVNTSAVTGPAPQSVWQTERYGNFTYTIPNLTAGAAYTVKLDFDEIFWHSAGQRLFNVSINGTQVMSNFDIYTAAGGMNKAIAESFNSTADSNGKITIVFTTLKDNAKVDGIEITPGANAPTTTSVKIDSGGAGSGGFIPDTYFNGGSTYGVNAAIDTSAVPNQPPQEVMDNERFGNFTYTIPNLTAGGTYSVRLDFDEIYWNAANDRVFDVAINGTPVLTNFDIYAAVGQRFKAIAKTFTAIADSQGRIVISFTSVINFAKISGIEIAAG